MKGVILAAGYGSRFLPASRVVPKELLPLGTRPALDFIVQEFTDAGVDELLVISSDRKEAIERWFLADPALDASFDRARLAYPRIPSVSFVRQTQMLGTGHAALQAADFAGNDPLLVAFPDDVFPTYNVSKALVDAWKTTGHTVLACSTLDGDVSRYGVIDVEPSDGDCLPVRGIVEKPTPGSEPSKHVSWGRYLYTPDMFEALASGFAAHGSGEFPATFGINALAQRGRVSARIVPDARVDTGTPLAYAKAFINAACEDPDWGDKLQNWLNAKVSATKAD